MRLAASQIFSRTARPAKTLGTWVLMPMPRRAISWAWAREMCCPRNSTRPWLGASWPVSILKNVLLPAPFGPIRHRSSPSSSAKLTSRTARTPPKFTPRSMVCRSGAAIILLRRVRFEVLALHGAAGAPGQQPLPQFGERRHKAFRHQQYERDQDGAEDERGIGENLRPPVGAGGLVCAQRRAEPLNADAADDRSDQRATAADDDPDDDLRRLGEAEDVRADEVAPVREQAAGKAGQRATDGEGCKLVGPGVVAEELGTPLVFADADDDPAEAACQQQAQSEIGSQQREGGEIEHAFQIDHGFLVAGDIERGNSRNAVESAEPRHADVEFGPGRGIDGIEQDQGHRQRDDAEIHLADTAVEHEISEQRRKRRRKNDRKQERKRAFAEVEHRDRVGVGAKAEKCRLAEA